MCLLSWAYGRHISFLYSCDVVGTTGLLENWEHG